MERWRRAAGMALVRLRFVVLLAAVAVLAVSRTAISTVLRQLTRQDALGVPLRVAGGEPVPQPFRHADGFIVAGNNERHSFPERAVSSPSGPVPCLTAGWRYRAPG